MNLFAQVENMNGGQILDFILFESQGKRLASSFDNVAHRLTLNNLSGGWYRVFVQSLAYNTRYRLILTAATSRSFPDAGNSPNSAVDLGGVNQNGQVRVDSVSPGDADWFRIQVAQNSTQVKVYLFDAQANDSARVALVNSSIRTMREVLVSENSSGPLMDTSLAAGTYYVSVTAAQGASGSVGTGYRLLVTGQGNTGSAQPPPLPPQATPPENPTNTRQPLDGGSNNRQLPTFIGGLFFPGRIVKTDSIGGGDSDDWYSIDANFIDSQMPRNRISFTLTGAANAGIEVYTFNGRTPIDSRILAGASLKELVAYLVPGTYLIHVIPIATQSPASGYQLKVVALDLKR
jgi:hypothetical protein